MDTAVVKSQREEIVVCQLGRVPFRETWDLQRRLQQRLVQAKKCEPCEHIPGVFLLVEHPPVFTLGKSGDVSNLLADSTSLASRGATFEHIDRGGDITYHGPGQIVGYPILDLERFYTDIHRYLRDLEESIIRTCTDLGLSTGRIPGRTGVWTRPKQSDDPDPSVGREGREGRERKIAALGIRCSRWVTMHGFAFNVGTDLEYFSLIVPCGISDRGVTSLEFELGRDISLSAVSALLLRHFSEIFGVDLRILAAGEAEPFLATYLGAANDVVAETAR